MIRPLIERLYDVVVHSADCAGQGRGDEHCSCDAVAVLRDTRRTLNDAADYRQALRNIAEGNLGDAPWQANYDKIRRVANAALAGHGQMTGDPIEDALRWVVDAHQRGELLGRAMDHAASVLEARTKE